MICVVNISGQGAKDENQLKDQLKLALTWNRSDIAEEKIFTDSTIWSQGKYISSDRLMEVYSVMFGNYNTPNYWEIK